MQRLQESVKASNWMSQTLTAYIGLRPGLPQDQGQHLRIEFNGTVKHLFAMSISCNQPISSGYIHPKLPGNILHKIQDQAKSQQSPETTSMDLLVLSRPASLAEGEDFLAY